MIVLDSARAAERDQAKHRKKIVSVASSPSAASAWFGRSCRTEAMWSRGHTCGENETNAHQKFLAAAARAAASALGSERRPLEIGL